MLCRAMSAMLYIIPCCASRANQPIAMWRCRVLNQTVILYYFISSASNLFVLAYFSCLALLSYDRFSLPSHSCTQVCSLHYYVVLHTISHRTAFFLPMHIMWSRPAAVSLVLHPQFPAHPIFAFHMISSTITQLIKSCFLHVVSAVDLTFFPPPLPHIISTLAHID
jgi:hypothetical protein